MNAIDPSVYYIIGMSPGNSYFKDEEIKYLLTRAIEKHGRVAIMIADIPAISTYIAFGYPENRARRDKAIPQGNLLKNRTERVMTELGYTGEQVRIIDWEKEVETSEEYKKSYEKVNALYQTNEKFREDTLETTKGVLVASKRDIPDIDGAAKIAVHYLLSEIAFLDWAPKFLAVDRVAYIYHKNWPVYENYIAGKYDGVPKVATDFVLTENPYETFNPICGLEEGDNDSNTYVDVLDRVEKTKIVRVGFSNYIPAFIYDREYDNFSGIFYEIIVAITKKYGWEIVWSEETGYGVVTDGLSENRFDLFGSTVWPTPERKEKANFSLSLYESQVFTWVREGFNKSEEEIRADPTIRVAVKENDISDSIAQASFPNNRQVKVPQLSHTTDLLKFVVEDRADLTLVEPYIAEYFNKSSEIKVVKASDNPIRTYENCFIFKKGEIRFKELIDRELEEMKRNGFVRELIKKYTGSIKTFD